MALRMQSPSSINLYKQCPRRYYYQYIAQLPTFPSIHLTRGHVAHSALEDFYKLDPADVSPHDDERTALQRHALQLLVDHWRQKNDEFKEIGLPEIDLYHYLEETKMMLINYINQWYEKLDSHKKRHNLSFADAFKALSPKTEELYKSEKHQVRGYVDVIELHEGKVRLMDYKTSKRPKMTDAYRLQLAIYAMLYNHNHDKMPHEVGIYFLKAGEITLPVDKGLIQEAEFEIEQIHMSTETDDIEDYPKKTSALCKWRTGQCDFYNTCMKGK